MKVEEDSSDTCDSLHLILRSAKLERTAFATPKATLSCERITTKWRRAKRAAKVRQIARQLQRSLGSRRHVARTATPTALNAVADCKKNGCSENSFAGVEECVLLELLITCRGFAMAFSGIYDPSTGNALRLGRKAKDPTKANDGRDYHRHRHKTRLNRLP